MPSVKNIFLDIGDIYTKVYIFDEENFLQNDACFPTIAKKTVVLKEACSYFKNAKSGNFMSVGWDATYEAEYGDIVGLKLKASIFDVINKVLFDYIDDKSKVNINLIANEANNDFHLDDLEKIYKEKRVRVEGYIYGQYLTKHYTINIKVYMAPHILKKFFTISTIKKNHDVLLVIDIGFKKTKLFVIDIKNDHTVFYKLFHGFDFYLIKLKNHFEDVGIHLHPFILLKELERNNTVIETDDGVYDISTIIENVRYDLCTALIREIEEKLKEFYNSFLVWPSFLYITGGGAILNAPVIKAELLSRYNQFSEANLVESKPRDYLLKICYQIS